MEDSELLPPHPDDRTWLLIDRFLAGECSSEEAAEMRTWLAADPTNAAELELVRRGRELAANRPPTRSVSAAWADARQELGLTAEHRIEREAAKRFSTLPKGSSPDGWAGRIAIAAVLVLSIGMGMLWRYRQVPPAPVTAAEPQYSVYSTLPGQRLSLHLSDGTSVILAPASELRMPKDYGKIDRRLELTGEAYFVVTHDSLRPFTVVAPTLIANDLGTRFAIRSYPDEPTSHMIVAEGRVEVIVPPASGGSDRTVVSATPEIFEANELAQVDQGGVLTRAMADAHDLTAWTNGQLILRYTPLQSAITQLERWYDIRIRLTAPGLALRPVTAVLQDEPASEALRLIAASLELSLDHRGNTYLLGPISQ
jgi:ferric-dicitrate binding protein FerR (iron transport regulator)